MPVTLLQELPQCRLGHVGSVYVSVWFNELTLEALDALDKHHRAIAAANGGQVTFISVAASANKVPDKDVRERLAREAPALAKLRRANIVVVTARGLGAIITRTFLAGLNLVSSEKMVIVKTFEEAAAEARALPDQDNFTKTNTRLAADLEAFANLPRTACPLY